MSRLLPPLLAMIAVAAPARAEQSAPAPVVIELFTSQSCSSCPPAEALFRDLASRKDVVALEWHVDYWDDLSAGASGRWKDPFSSADNTRRQRAYNLALKGEPSAYTPQIVVAGASETVGSRGAEIGSLIEAAKSHAAPARLAGEGEGLSVVAAPSGAKLRIVTFRRSATTAVGGGENHRRQLAEANVVTGSRVLGLAREGNSVPAPALKDGEGAALLIEDGRTGAVLAGAYF